MNISVNPMSLFVGSLAGIFLLFTIRVPIVCLLVALLAMFLTEAILRNQNKS